MFKSFNHGFIFQGLKQLFLLQVSFAWSCWDLNVFSLGWPVTELCVGVIRTISSLTPGPHQHLVISSHHLHENCGRSPNGFHPESPWKLLDAWRTSQSLKVVEATLAQLIPRDKMPLTVWVGDLWAKSFLFLKFPFLGPLFFFWDFSAKKGSLFRSGWATRDITKPTWRHLLPEKGRFIMRIGGLRDLRVVVEE